MDFSNKINFTQKEKEFIFKERKRNRLLSSYASKDEDAIYEYSAKNDYRTNYGRDCDGILNNVFYARFGDKTQVHSFYKNDDLTRRSLHVQYVSRIARTIGDILGLNTELIEAISIGHDIGHTPFGHKGEEFLDNLYFAEDGKHFRHNVHSVRVLKDISHRRFSLQTLDGILSHNGEELKDKLIPSDIKSFTEFEEKYKLCYENPEAMKAYSANTIEGCLVRVCDVLAYIGKDRQDLFKIGRSEKVSDFEDKGIGTKNAQIISNVSTNIIKNSFGKNYIAIDADVANALKLTLEQNNSIIYKSDFVTEQYGTVNKAFEFIFNLCIKDIKNGTDQTLIKRNFICQEYLTEYKKKTEEGAFSPADLAVDYIASMTDDYLIDLSSFLGFKDKIEYIGYFS